jgi:hypothetical protein
LSGLVAHNFDVYPANYAISYLIQGTTKGGGIERGEKGEELEREEKREKETN